jgi:hypothetical protein
MRVSFDGRVPWICASRDECSSRTSIFCLGGVMCIARVGRYGRVLENKPQSNHEVFHFMRWCKVYVLLCCVQTLKCKTSEKSLNFFFLSTFHIFMSRTGFCLRASMFLFQHGSAAKYGFAALGNCHRPNHTHLAGSAFPPPDHDSRHASRKQRCIAAKIETLLRTRQVVDIDSGACWISWSLEVYWLRSDYSSRYGRCR